MAFFAGAFDTILAAGFQSEASSSSSESAKAGFLMLGFAAAARFGRALGAPLRDGRGMPPPILGGGALIGLVSSSESLPPELSFSSELSAALRFAGAFVAVFEGRGAKIGAAIFGGSGSFFLYIDAAGSLTGMLGFLDCTACFSSSAFFAARKASRSSSPAAA